MAEHARMFDPSRDQARLFFIDAWRKHLARDVVSPLEDAAIRLVALHPEYHGLLAEGETALEREWTPESGEANPFLHLSLHLAVEEQLAIDQPPGLRAAFEALLARQDDRHAALHVLLECLGETLWRAQKSQSPPDGEAYVECVRRKAG
jgi:hypothetical protein